MAAPGESPHKDQVQALQQQQTPGGGAPGNSSQITYSKLVEERTLQDYGAGKYGAHVILLCVVSVYSFLLIIAAISTNVYTKTTSQWYIHITMWNSETCLIGGDCWGTTVPEDLVCYDRRVRQRAIQALAILALLASIVAIAFSGLDIVQRCPHPILPIFTFGLCHIFTLTSWGLIAGGYHQNHCDTSYKGEDYKMSVSFVLFLCLWISQFFMAVFYFMKRFFGAYQRKALEYMGDAAADARDKEMSNVRTPNNYRNSGSSPHRGISASGTRRDGDSNYRRSGQRGGNNSSSNNASGMGYAMGELGGMTSALLGDDEKQTSSSHYKHHSSGGEQLM